jgi:predicted ArsR family transcriptional regulator
MSDNMSPRGREETVSLDEIVEAAAETEGPFFGVSEVADKVEIGPERVRQRLRDLEEQGVLDHKRVGSGKGYYFKR